MAKKILIAAACVLAALVILVGGYIFFMLSRISRTDGSLGDAEVIAMTEPVDPAATPAPTPEQLENSELSLELEMQQTKLSPEEQAALEQAEKKKNVTNILFLGVDRRGTSGGSRSDTTMIATLDGNNKRLKLTSLMRDMYINIPGVGENRFNAACTKGGPELVMQTINENFSMELKSYVLVDFSSFEKIIDRIGGITVEMSSGEVSEANDCIAGLNKQRGDELTSGLIKKRKGSIKLTGKQALGYARMRHFGDGDYARTSRQAKVMQQVMNVFLKLDALEQQKVMYDLLPLVETNLSNTDIIGLMVQALAIGNTDILHYRLPVQDTYKSKKVRGMNVLLPDVPANAQALHQFIYEAAEQGALERSDTSKGKYYAKSAAAPEASGTDIETGDGTVTDEGIPDDPAIPDDSTVPDDGVPDDAAELNDEEGVTLLD